MWGNVGLVVLTVALTAAFTWLLDGGLKRRIRTTIREELELADVLERSSPKRSQSLQDRAIGRLDAYLRPPWWRRSREAVVAMSAAVVGAAALTTAAVMSTKQSAHVPRWEQWLGGTLSGLAIAALFTAITQIARSYAAIRFEKARVAARVRYFQEHRDELHETAERLRRTWDDPEDWDGEAPPRG